MRDIPAVVTPLLMCVFLLADCDFSISIVPVADDKPVKDVEKKKKPNKDKQAATGGASPGRVQVRLRHRLMASHAAETLHTLSVHIAEGDLS